MNNQELTELVKRSLFDVAPDLASEIIDPNTRFNDQFEFDSMDFLNLVAGLHRDTGLDLPEKDYPRLMTLASAVEYLIEKLAK